MPQSTIERLIYGFILLAYLVLGVLFALRTPDWQAPDEPAHYNVIAQMADGNLMPVIEMGDWDNDYLETLKAEDFSPELLDNLDSIQYEDHQPPLYYWLGTPIFWITGGSLTALRLYSVLLGGITVALSFAITRRVFPNRLQVALGAMALVAFLPQQLHMTSTVNNDALGGVMIGAILLTSLIYLTQPEKSIESITDFFRPNQVHVWQIGLLVGIAFITKTTTYFMAGVALIVIVMRWIKMPKRDFSALGFTLLSFAIPSGLFALLYWGRNLFVYGIPDFLGLVRHDDVVVGQLRTADYIEQIGMAQYVENAVKTTFHSFWGQFGWMEARMADALPLTMVFIGLLILAALSGLLIFAAQKSENDEKISGTIWIMLGLVMLLALLQYVYYNLTFVQFQGRYIFTGIIPFALGMALGVDVWRNMLAKNMPVLSWATVAIFLLFVPLDFYLIWRVIPGAVGGTM